MVPLNTLVHFTSLLSLSFLLLSTPLVTTHAKLPNKTNTAAAAATTTTYIIQTDNLTRPSQFTSQTQWYASIIQSLLPIKTSTTSTAAAVKRIFYTYETVLHGFAVTLTPPEAQTISTITGVIGVYEDRTIQPLTTRSPDFLGFNTDFGLWPESNSGQDVVIGLVDTGIWPESRSFDDVGLPPVRATWRGQCVDGTRFNASLLCNNKLVGARYFAAGMLASGLLFVDDVNEYLSPRDKNGHGTHTSSTAGGGVVPDADFFGYANGTARGLAPRARLAMYKACWGTVGCYKSDILAAIDNAVRDGVDVLSLSIGSPFGQDLYDSDPVAVGTFAAARAGIFVTCSAGNSGPYAGTVTNSAPWVATVGAGTIDRSFPARVVLGNGKVLLGQSLYFQEVNQSEMIELVYVGLCYPDLLVPATVMGKIVICNDATVGTGLDVEEAGAAGLIAVNLPRDGEGIIAQGFTLPAVAVRYAAEGDIRKYLNSSAGKPVAMLELRYRRTVIGETRAPTVAGFSSRGPSQASPEILKPDVIAPGMNILAAWPPESPLYKGSYEDPRRSAFNIVSGTSMASPHVAGLAAALRGAHPTWTPAMVRSAIMTTAATLDNNYRPIIANENSQPATPFAVGAGHINPPTARDPGLVYDAGVQDYIDFLCALNYTDEQRHKIVGGPTTCSEIEGGVAGINYPSFVVIFNNRTSTKVLKRTLKKVYELPEIYNVRIVNPMPEKVEVRVKPDLLEFKGVNEIRSYEVEFKSKVVMKGSDKCEEYGFIIWENMEHQVKSPVVFMWE